ncbi:hypothetical protein [Streptomyces sp. 049-1]|uniref:hypothetical protein n=1 Tax=Streptomyces sp. 049-1 TaxID=2789264 RepID=UPI0039800B0B
MIWLLVFAGLVVAWWLLAAVANDWPEISQVLRRLTRSARTAAAALAARLRTSSARASRTPARPQEVR